VGRALVAGHRHAVADRNGRDDPERCTTGVADVEQLGGALLEAPDALPQVVRTWCVHHDLGHAAGRDRYKTRVGMSR